MLVIKSSSVESSLCSTRIRQRTSKYEIIIYTELARGCKVHGVRTDCIQPMALRLEKRGPLGKREGGYARAAKSCASTVFLNWVEMFSVQRIMSSQPRVMILWYLWYSSSSSTRSLNCLALGQSHASAMGSRRGHSLRSFDKFELEDVFLDELLSTGSYSPPRILEFIGNTLYNYLEIVLIFKQFSCVNRVQLGFHSAPAQEIVKAALLGKASMTHFDDILNIHLATGCHFA